MSQLQFIMKYYQLQLVVRTLFWSLELPDGGWERSWDQNTEISLNSSARSRFYIDFTVSLAFWQLHHLQISSLVQKEMQILSTSLN